MQKIKWYEQIWPKKNVAKSDIRRQSLNNSIYLEGFVVDSLNQDNLGSIEARTTKNSSKEDGIK